MGTNAPVLPGCADDALRSTTAVLQRATAAPCRASASRRRPPLRGRWWGWRARLLSRGCGGAAAFSREGPGVRTEVCARGCTAGCLFRA